jgi:hypothetical protein
MGKRARYKGEERRGKREEEVLTEAQRTQSSTKGRGLTTEVTEFRGVEFGGTEKE